MQDVSNCGHSALSNPDLTAASRLAEDGLRSRCSVYYTIVTSCWCIALGRESWMRLTYRRDEIFERGYFRDFLICAEPIAAANAA